jgi:hypothetical protein
MKSQVLLLALMVMLVFGGVNLVFVFAMHDSTLEVNTWIASDNSTQLHTTDLNRGPISPTVPAGDTADSSIVTPTTPDADEESAGENGDEDEDEEESAGDEDDDDDEGE